MKQFAFIQKNPLSNIYGSFLHKYRKYDGVMEFMKIGILTVVLLVCGISYLYFINLASTRGYFLRKENQKLSAITFQFEILKTKMLSYKQENWDAIHGSAFKRDVVDVSAEVVKVPTTVELGMLK